MTQSEFDSAVTLSVAEIASLLKRSPQSIYPLIRSGEIPSRKFGGKIVVPAAALRAMLGMSAGA